MESAKKIGTQKDELSRKLKTSQEELRSYDNEKSRLLSENEFYIKERAIMHADLHNAKLSLRNLADAQRILEKIIVSQKEFNDKLG
ncbi:hypothetical protein HA378_32380, partial [Escherichia coli]|nr:hypothetical protein [Escherichia coli]